MPLSATVEGASHDLFRHMQTMGHRLGAMLVKRTEAL